MRLVVASVLSTLFLVNPASADLVGGQKKLAAGDYAGALAELAAVSGADRGKARLEVARAQLITGDLVAAEKTAAALTASRDAAIATESKLLLAEIRLSTGRPGDALRDLTALTAANPKHLEARRVLAATLRELGKRAEAAAVAALTIADYDGHRLDLDDAEQLFQLAEAARIGRHYQLANESYGEALKIAPGHAEAAIARAELFLGKYAAELAEETLEELFKVNPNHPEAHAVMAAVQLEKSYDLAAVAHHVGLALAIDPRNPRALLVRAAVEIDQHRWDAADQSLAKVLATNPRHLEARAMRATVAWLRDELPRYEKERAAILADNPAYADFYRVVARSAVREHRYQEAIALEEEAVKLDPELFEAMSGIGLGYLRLGKEKEGLAWLERSWKGDPFNVRTFNTLELFEKVIPREYVFVTTKNFRIRYHKDEAKVLGRYLEPMLERAYEDMAARYRVRPAAPITLELYASRDDYAIRTVGLPDLGALGVCFGRVITAMSPTNGDLNWGMILWHELGHVFALAISRQRVPRWFTEGLSEYETLIARPEWRRENDADVYAAMQANALPSIAELDWQFVQPNPQGVMVAYYLSAVAVEYLAQTVGFPKLVEALRLFGQGKETPEVMRAITGKTVGELDAAFRDYLAERLAPYRGTFRMPTAGLDDVTKVEIEADAAPRDGARRARVAAAYFAAGDATKAMAAAEAAIALDAKNAVARYVAAEVKLHAGDAQGAAALYRGLVGDGVDSFDIRARLAQIAQSSGDGAEMEKQLCAAKRLDPERSLPYQELAAYYAKAGKQEQALAELEHLVMLEQMQLAPLKELVVGYSKLGRWAKVRTFGVMATYIDPGDGELLMSLARAHLELDDGAAAVATYDNALVAEPPLRRPALAHLGRAKALLAMGDKAKARAALKEAQKTEPENAEVVELAKTLK